MQTSSRQLAAKSLMLDWQVAPADWQIANYDEFKVNYRREVENFLKPLALKSLKNKTFVTISTNVLCADIASSIETNHPIDRDLYLPLEIALTKYSVADSNKPLEQRNLNTRVWLLNPGPPITGSNKYASDQRNQFHKIDYANINSNDKEFRQDFVEVAKEINSMLTPDRTVFSTQLRNCRQDLGCLKWINKQINSKIKPIKVFSLEDLYVVLVRRMLPEADKQLICQGIARHRMEFTTNTYEPDVKCSYHKESGKLNEDCDTAYCAKALSECFSNVLLNDLNYFIELTATHGDQQTVTPTQTVVQSN